MANISMADIGERLKQAREKRSLTIDQAQKQTHIHSRIIAALEEGRCDEILSRTYVKSFLKTYSRYLGLDQKEILCKYESTHPQPARPTISLNKEEPGIAVKAARLFYIIGASALIIVLVFSGIFLWKKTAVFLRKSGSPRRVARSKAILPPAKGTAQKKAAGTATLKPKNVQRKETSSRSASGQGLVPKNTPFNLAIKVNQPVLIQLKKDGVLLFKRVLPKGTVESFRANESINIFVAKSEAIEIILNGHTLDLPSRGVIKDLEITRKGIRIK